MENTSVQHTDETLTINQLTELIDLFEKNKKQFIKSLRYPCVLCVPCGKIKNRQARQERKGKFRNEYQAALKIFAFLAFPVVNLRALCG